MCASAHDRSAAQLWLRNDRAHDPPLTIVVLPEAEEGAELLTVEPDVDDESDDEPEADEDVVADDVVAAELVAAAAVVLPATVSCASTPRPPTASAAPVAVERSTRLRRRKARSRRAAARFSVRSCECGCEGLEFISHTLTARDVMPIQTNWEPVGKRVLTQRSESATAVVLAQAQGKRGAGGRCATRVAEQCRRHCSRCDDRVAPFIEFDQLGEQLRAHAVSGARDAVDGEMQLAHLNSRPPACVQPSSGVLLRASRTRARTPRARCVGAGQRRRGAGMRLGP